MIKLELTDTEFAWILSRLNSEITLADFDEAIISSQKLKILRPFAGKLLKAQRESIYEKI